ncbi:hypothetical protein IWX92DRAFT_380307 [Phyllosticta citricarpa]
MIPLIALEEHYQDARLLPESSPHDARPPPFPKPIMDRLYSLGDDRLDDMDHNNIALQVLSHTPVNPTPDMSRAVNDRLASITKRHPSRYAGFALLPLREPQQAAKELKRCVRELGFVGALISNHCNGHFYDGPKFWPLFAAAQDLDVPIYLHPTLPTDETKQALYEGEYPEPIAQLLGSFGWGWHSETGLHILRLFAAGVFDCFPRLKVIIGHMGEMLPFQLDRIIDVTSSIKDPEWSGREFDLSHVWKNNIWITTSGMFSLAPMACLLRVTPIDKIMLSVDYPFSKNKQARAFVEELAQSNLVSRWELESIAYRNAQNLLRIPAVQEAPAVRSPARNQPQPTPNTPNQVGTKRSRSTEDENEPNVSKRVERSVLLETPNITPAMQRAVRKEERRKCQFCDRVFSRVEHKVRHEKTTHMGERPHKCSHCSKAFSRSDNLLQHYRTVHGLDGGPPHNGERSRGGRRKTKGTHANSPDIDGYAGNDEHGYIHHSDELSPGIDSNSNPRSPGQDSLELDRLAGNDPDQPEDQESEYEQVEKVDEDVEDQDQMDLKPDVNAEGSSSIRHPQVVCYRCNESITQTPLRDRDNRPICESCLDKLPESLSSLEASTAKLQCRNCFAKKTSKWRKDGNGHVACSACYLYFRKHKKNRPRELQDLKDMKSCYYCNTYLGFVPPTLDEDGRTRCESCLGPAQRSVLRGGSSAAELRVIDKSDLSGHRPSQSGSLLSRSQGSSWQAINRNTSAEPAAHHFLQRASPPGPGKKSQSEPVEKRPRDVSSAKKGSQDTASLESQEEESYDHSCSNCQTADTSVWQFDVVGRRICNACYQYHEIHGVNRPPYLRREHVLERSQSRARDQSHRPKAVGKAAEEASPEQEPSSAVNEASAMQSEAEPANLEDVQDDSSGEEKHATAGGTAGEEMHKKTRSTPREQTGNDTDDARKAGNVNQEDDKD